MSSTQKLLAALLKKPYSQFQLQNYDPSQPVRLVIGSGFTFSRGWIQTDIETLNILKKEDWAAYFRENSVDRILAEHVWEHFTPADGKLAFTNCHTFLKPGGVLRVAVPDGFHPNPAYIDMVKPGGTGNGADDHKVLYTYQSMAAVLEEVGFKVLPLEYFDENGKFHKVPWSTADGMILRSAEHDARNKNGELVYTSLLIDAQKQ
jgi:predicted SAM-dependent methyltransferase